MIKKRNKAEITPSFVLHGGGSPSRSIRRSPSAERYRRFYKTYRWQQTRARQLTRRPLCERCSKRGKVVTATVCHHVDPDTKLNPETFFAGPFESLCQSCHDGPMQQIERIGYSNEVGVDGWPIDERHWVNRITGGV